uniref:Mediator of RNA polymerase II transcription subunit 11 n=1 Tax=Schistosoma mansoni TaxID=6183 RepID=A0AA82N7T5_SCHMA
MFGISKDRQSEASLESRLNNLDEVERKISLVIEHAGSALEELSKDRPTVKQVESCTHNFRTVIMEVDMEVTSHINYLSHISAGLPYEGCTYDKAIDFYRE